MDLKQFKSWKLLYEDDDLCFSKAVNDIDKTDVFFITFFQPDKMSIATKHLVADRLHNYVSLIEEDDKLHLILKAQQGHAIKKFIKRSLLEYDDRVQIVYAFLKSVEKYDAFPYAIQIQLLDDEQLLISDEGVLFRELIDYTASQQYTLKDVYKQLGKTLDIILFDAEGYHSQFIYNLLLGNHKFDSLKSIKNSFKDVFIFEKPEAVDAINHEYTIIINDLEAGPPIKFSDTTLATIKEIDHAAMVFESAHLSHDELQRELVDLLITPTAQEAQNLKTINDEIASEESIVDDAIEIEASLEVVKTELKVPIEPEAIEAEAHKVDDEIEPMYEKEVESDKSIVDASMVDHSKMSFKEQFTEDSKLPEQLPKSSKQRYLDEENDLFIDDMEQLFGDYEEDETIDVKNSKLPKLPSFRFSGWFRKFRREDAIDTLDESESEAESEAIPESVSKSITASVSESESKSDSNATKFYEPVGSKVEVEVEGEDDSEGDVEVDAEGDSASDQLDAFKDDTKRISGFNKKIVLMAIAVILIVILSIFAIKSLMPTEPVAAQFIVEPLLEDRVAFMNTSTGDKNIKSYSWEIYYADLLVQTFTEKDLFPVFETEGKYKIVLRVQDKKGHWSEPFTDEYEFLTTETP